MKTTITVLGLALSCAGCSHDAIHGGFTPHPGDGSHTSDVSDASETSDTSAVNDDASASAPADVVTDTWTCAAALDSCASTTSYLQTCSGCTTDTVACTVTCGSCAKADGTPNSNPGLILPCCGDIANIDGILQCSR
jgi:hypothetical protein